MTPRRGKVLFLCTGNYYRSRFAEMLFNARAEEARLAWTADSGALAPDLTEIPNVGSISTYAVAALEVRGIRLGADVRLPMQTTEADLASADLVIAMEETEHRPLLRQRFPAWEDRVEYWHIHDLDRSAPEEALGEIERRIAELLARLAANGRLRRVADDCPVPPEKR